MAEKTDAVVTAAAAHYLQALMLERVARGDMSRRKIMLVNDWLSRWCSGLSLSRIDDGSGRQFVVDMNSANGARPAHEHEPPADGRYWRMDDVRERLQAMRDLLERGRLPPDFPPAIALPNALRFVDKLLSAWSPQAAQRERRRDERRNVARQAQVVHGIFHVCQHLKNAHFAAIYPQAGPDDDSVMQTGWQIGNESGSGYGTQVQAEGNHWLEPGCLVAMNVTLNPGVVAVGVVRNIAQSVPQHYSAGVEVLSHTPRYVRLQRLAIGSSGEESLPFPAIFLPADSLEHSPTLILPLIYHAAQAVYEMRASQSEHLAQSGRVIEQQADWVRVAVDLADDITL
jgi:hypothetical protein